MSAPHSHASAMACGSSNRSAQVRWRWAREAGPPGGRGAAAKLGSCRTASASPSLPSAILSLQLLLLQQACACFAPALTPQTHDPLNPLNPPTHSPFTCARASPSPISEPSPANSMHGACITDQALPPLTPLTCARASASPSPRFTPCPARGCTAWAASPTRARRGSTYLQARVEGRVGVGRCVSVSAGEGR